MKYLALILSLITVLLTYSQEKQDPTRNFPKQEIKITEIPKKENIWVYVMAGQSNMAGRGLVEPQDTIINKRVLTINKKGELIYAKEPIHFNEPKMAGLDMGHAFGNEMVRKLPDSISVLLIPTAVGASSIEKWINNTEHRNIKLLENFEAKVKIAESYGTIKGILWHQGESNAKSKSAIKQHKENLSTLFSKFRSIIGDDKLQIVVGELGRYAEAKKTKSWKKLNKKIKAYVKTDPYAKLVSSEGLKDWGDKVHFNSESLRILGKRYAQQILKD